MTLVALAVASSLSLTAPISVLLGEEAGLRADLPLTDAEMTSGSGPSIKPD